MTPYERGQRDMQRRAAEVCTTIATDGSLTPGKEALPAIYCAEQILSLPIVGEADQRVAANGDGGSQLAAAQTLGSAERTGDRQNDSAQSVTHHNPGEPVAQVMYEMANDGKCGLVAWFKSPRSLPDGTLLYAHPARPGPSQECVSDLSERLRQYADIADAGGKAHWANAMREAMYTLAVYRQNAAKEEHDAPR